MNISGTVKDSSSGKVTSNALVTFASAGRDLKSTYTSSTGRFDESVLVSTPTESLLCRIEKDGYHNKEVPCPTDQDRIDLGVIALEPETVSIQVTVEDESGSPLKNKTVIFELEGKEIARETSGVGGVLQLTLLPSIVKQPVSCHIDEDGFTQKAQQIIRVNATEWRVKIPKQQTAHERNMKFWKISLLVMVPISLTLHWLIPQNIIPLFLIFSSLIFSYLKPVKGLIPSRSGVAGLRCTTILQRP